MKNNYKKFLLLFLYFYLLVSYMYSEKDKVYPNMLSIYHDIGIDKQYSYFIMKMDISYLSFINIISDQEVSKEELMKMGKQDIALKSYFKIMIALRI